MCMMTCFLRKSRLSLSVNVLKFSTGTYVRRSIPVVIPDAYKPSRKDAFTSKARVLKDVFGYSSAVLRKLAQTKQLAHVNEYELVQLANTLMKIKIRPQDVNDSTNVLTVPVNTVKRYGEFLKDLGVENVTGKMIQGFPNLICRPCKLVKAYLNISEHASLVENLLASLPTDYQVHIRTSLGLYNEEESNFHELWEKIMVLYLSKKLGLSTDQVQMSMKGNTLNKLPRSLRHLETTINELLEMQFTPQEIIEDDRFLSSEPRALIVALNGHLGLTGGDSLNFLKQNQEIFAMNPDFVQRNLETLNEFDVEVLAIKMHLQALDEIPGVLREQLEKVKKIQGYEIFRYHPHFLRCIKYVDQMNYRLKMLMSADPRHVSLSALTLYSEKRFEEVVHCGKQLRVPLEVLYYLSHTTNTTKEEVLRKIHSYLNWQQINLINVLRVVEFLRKHECTPEQIFHGLFLVIYPFKVVEKTFNKVSALQSLLLPKAKNKNPSLLRIAHYYLEKDHAFSGWGVYSTEESVPWDQELKSSAKNKS